MSRILRIACKGGSLKNGGSPSTISIIIIPNDHISTSGPYGRWDITSGDIQYGVPTKDFRFGSSSETWAQNPKSDSFTFPSIANKIESDLISRWITPCKWNVPKRAHFKGFDYLRMNINQSFNALFRYCWDLLQVHPRMCDYIC